MLTEIIKRYRPDEDDAWHEGMKQTIMASDLVKDRFRLIGILLDPKGLTSAFPGKCCEDCDWTQCPPEENHPWSEPFSEHVAHRIFDAWIADGAQKAIETAFHLLP